VCLEQSIQTAGEQVGRCPQEVTLLGHFTLSVHVIFVAFFWGGGQLLSVSLNAVRTLFLGPSASAVFFVRIS
jgi:hypothetical protein